MSKNSQIVVYSLTTKGLGDSSVNGITVLACALRL